LKPRPEIPSGPYLVVGLARSGVAAALALRAADQQVVGVDAGAPPGTRALRDAGVELHQGRGGVELLERVRAVVKSPGVPAQAPLIAAARERGLPVLGELELAWRLLANEFIAVTGTNGKTTTVELIGHIHREAGLPVAVAGNVGVAASTLAGEIDRRVTVVCESSSFQLEDTLAFAPEAAVLLNVAPDHLDRHGTFEAYLRAKLRIFANKGPEDVAVAPAELLRDLGGLGVDDLLGQGLERLIGHAHALYFGTRPEAEMHERDGELFFRGRALLAVSELRLRGRHNVENAMAAAAVCLERGVDPEAVRAGLRSFAGVAHRLEEVARAGGVLYVNDSKATNVASTLVALESFPDAAGIHLILGGQGKDQDFSALVWAVGRRCRAVYLIGQDAPAIARALKGAGVPVHDCGQLGRAVAGAGRAAASGEVVMLSPACASFDQFADYQERGERFRELVAGASRAR
jgi:UDP-N-acetylmuramoylalanine--D-glutamate ligase